MKERTSGLGKKLEEMEVQLKKMLILKADEMLENMESQLKYLKISPGTKQLTKRWGNQVTDTLYSFRAP